MPAWSPEIAEEFIRLAAFDDRYFDQMALQRLVYIAHGLHLALTGEPLTGDRPEAWESGPVYRRLADQFGAFGANPINRRSSDIERRPAEFPAASNDSSELNESERDLIEQVYQTHGQFSAAQLSTLTRGADTPWNSIFAEGAGKFREIPHRLVRDQFVEFTAPRA